MIYQSFFEALFEYAFLQRALFTSILVGIVCGLVGVFIVLKKLVFLGAGIAHASFAGGALGILVGINPFFTIFFFGASSALSIGYINEKGYIEDNNVAVGIIFSLTMALGVLFVSLIPSYNVSVTALLFGNVLVVTTEDAILLFIFTILIISMIYFMKKELFFVTFDEEMARATGLPVRLLSYIFLFLISLAIVISLKSIGALLVFAMIITPAAAAYQWSYKINNIIYLSVSFGACSAFIGLYLSYILDLPSGSTITVTVSIIFAISMLFSPKRRGGKHVGYGHADICTTCQRADQKGACEFCEHNKNNNANSKSEKHLHSHNK
ncbi:MAG: metal ABC transporter permease [Promethearchaeia archaeon]